MSVQAFVWFAKHVLLVYCRHSATKNWPNQQTRCIDHSLSPVGACANLPLESKFSFYPMITVPVVMCQWYFPSTIICSAPSQSMCVDTTLDPISASICIGITASLIPCTHQNKADIHHMKPLEGRATQPYSKGRFPGDAGVYGFGCEAVGGDDRQHWPWQAGPWQ